VKVLLIQTGEGSHSDTDQTRGRSQFLYSIKVSDKEIEMFIKGFDSVRSQGYDAKSNRTCCSAVSKGLVEIGALKEVTRLPNYLRSRLELGYVSKNGFDVGRSFLPQGSNLNNFPKDIINGLNKYRQAP
jgi:hypothetical protein